MIIPFEKKHIPQLLELFQLNTPMFFAPSEQKDFALYLESHSAHYFVFVEQNMIIAAGGYNLGFDGGKTARLAWDIIHPDKQGIGIGTTLVHFRLNEIKKHQEVNKIVVRTSQVVFAFYQKMGFQIESIVQDYWAPSFDLYAMKMDVRH